MKDVSLEQEIVTELHKLDSEAQLRVLEYVRRLAHPKGESGKAFLERTQHIHIDPDDLKLMAQAIADWCEQIDDFPEVDFDA